MDTWTHTQLRAGVAHAPHLPAPSLHPTASQASWDYIGSDGEALTFQTNLDAPRYRVVRCPSISSAGAPDSWPSIIPQDDKDLLQWACLIKGGTQPLMAVCWLRDVVSKLELRAFANGALVRELPMPGIGSVGGFSGSWKHSEFFFSVRRRRQRGVQGGLRAPAKTGVARPPWHADAVVVSRSSPRLLSRAPSSAWTPPTSSPRRSSSAASPAAASPQTTLRPSRCLWPARTARASRCSSSTARASPWTAPPPPCCTGMGASTSRWSPASRSAECAGCLLTMGCTRWPTCAVVRRGGLGGGQPHPTTLDLPPSVSHHLPLACPHPPAPPGGEYGIEWRNSGSCGKKQNVFDDFQARGVHLRSQRLTA